jgi:hypothetical protein
MAHAELSPSSAERWMTCPGSVVLCKGIPDKSSKYADEGTAAHAIAAACLTSGEDAYSYVGAQVNVADEGEEEVLIKFTNEMAVPTQQYIDYARNLTKSLGGEMRIEQKLSIEHLTGEEGATGTTDLTIANDKTLFIGDLKFGMGLQVDAEGNWQLIIYALSVMEEMSLSYDFEEVTIAIHQPRMNNTPDFTYTMVEMADFKRQVQEGAARVREAELRHEEHGASEDWVQTYLHDSPKACKWCRAAADCPKLTQTVMDMFEDVKPETATTDRLADAMNKTDVIEIWVKAVRARVETNLLDGTPVRGYKLVQGKKGNRKFADEAAAELYLKKSARLKDDEMYKFELLSPPALEKRLKPWVDSEGAERKPILGPRQWATVKEMITQADGGISVAPESDKRPAVVRSAAVDDFADLTKNTSAPADDSDLS